jgi:hypothetical protein
VNNWKKLTNSRNRVRKKSFGGTFCFSNCHIIRLDTGGLVFLVSDATVLLATTLNSKVRLGKQHTNWTVDHYNTSQFRVVPNNTMALSLAIHRIYRC